MLNWYRENAWWLVEVFHWSPLVCVLPLLRLPSIRTWLVVAAFLVSVLADSLGGHWIVSATYPVLQCGMLYGLFAPKRLAVKLAVTTAVLAGIAAGFGSYSGPDALLRLFTAAALVRLTPSPYRATVIVYFGLGAVMWAPLAFLPWSVWWLGCFLAYQVCRLLGLGLLTVAVWRERPPG